MQLTGEVGGEVGASDGKDVGTCVGCGQRYRTEEMKLLAIGNFFPGSLAEAETLTSFVGTLVGEEVEDIWGLSVG